MRVDGCLTFLCNMQGGTVRGRSFVRETRDNGLVVQSRCNKISNSLNITVN